MLRQKWSGDQAEERLANLPRCLIGMEACVGAASSVNRRGVRAPIGHPKCLINFVSTGLMLRSDSHPMPVCA